MHGAAAPQVLDAFILAACWLSCPSAVSPPLVQMETRDACSCDSSMHQGWNPRFELCMVGLDTTCQSCENQHKCGTVEDMIGNGNRAFAGDCRPGTAAVYGSCLTGREAALAYPVSITIDAADNLYIADSGNNRVRMYTRVDDSIVTIAGSGELGWNGDGPQPGRSTMLRRPESVAVRPNVALPQVEVWFSDFGNHRVRRAFKDLASDDWYVETMVGAGESCEDPSCDCGCDPKLAILSNPRALVWSSNGEDLYIADSGHQKVRRVQYYAGTGFSVMSTYIGDVDPLTLVNCQYTSSTSTTMTDNATTTDTETTTTDATTTLTLTSISINNSTTTPTTTSCLRNVSSHPYWNYEDNGRWFLPGSWRQHRLEAKLENLYFIAADNKDRLWVADSGADRANRLLVTHLPDGAQDEWVNGEMGVYMYYYLQAFGHGNATLQSRLVSGLTAWGPVFLNQLLSSAGGTLSSLLNVTFTTTMTTIGTTFSGVAGTSTTTSAPDYLYWKYAQPESGEWCTVLRHGATSRQLCSEVYAQYWQFRTTLGFCFDQANTMIFNDFASSQVLEINDDEVRTQDLFQDVSSDENPCPCLRFWADYDVRGRLALWNSLADQLDTTPFNGTSVSVLRESGPDPPNVCKPPDGDTEAREEVKSQLRQELYYPMTENNVDNNAAREQDGTTMTRIEEGEARRNAVSDEELNNLVNQLPDCDTANYCGESRPERGHQICYLDCRGSLSSCCDYGPRRAYEWRRRIRNWRYCDKVGVHVTWQPVPDSAILGGETRNVVPWYVTSTMADLTAYGNYLSDDLWLDRAPGDADWSQAPLSVVQHGLLYTHSRQDLLYGWVACNGSACLNQDPCFGMPPGPEYDSVEDMTYCRLRNIADFTNFTTMYFSTSASVVRLVWKQIDTLPTIGAGGVTFEDCQQRCAGEEACTSFMVQYNPTSQTYNDATNNLCVFFRNNAPYYVYETSLNATARLSVQGPDAWQTFVRRSPLSRIYSNDYNSQTPGIWVSPAGSQDMVAVNGGPHGRVSLSLEGCMDKCLENSECTAVAYPGCYLLNRVNIMDQSEAPASNRSIVYVKVRTGAKVRGIAGYPDVRSYEDGNPIDNAQINRPTQCVVDSEGSVIFADAWNQRIRKIKRKRSTCRQNIKHFSASSMDEWVENSRWTTHYCNFSDSYLASVYTNMTNEVLTSRTTDIMQAEFCNYVHYMNPNVEQNDTARRGWLDGLTRNTWALCEACLGVPNRPDICPPMEMCDCHSSIRSALQGIVYKNCPGRSAYHDEWHLWYTAYASCWLDETSVMYLTTERSRLRASIMEYEDLHSTATLTSTTVTTTTVLTTLPP